MNPLVKKATALLPSLPQRFNTGDELVHYVKGCEAIRLAVNEAIDYRIGEALAKAKEELDHGQFLPACEALGYSRQDALRLKTWYEECKRPESGHLDPFQAEQKMSRHAREEFCRSTPEVKAVVIEDISNPEVTKITAADIKRMSPLFGLSSDKDELDAYTPIAEQFELLIKLLKQAHNDNSHPQFAWSSYSAYLGFASDLVGCHYSSNNIESDQEGAITVEAW